MYITEKQAMILFQIAIDSIKMNIINSSCTIQYEARIKLVEQIFKQQPNDKLLDLKPDGPKNTEESEYEVEKPKWPEGPELVEESEV